MNGICSDFLGLWIEIGILHCLGVHFVPSFGLTAHGMMGKEFGHFSSLVRLWILRRFNLRFSDLHWLGMILEFAFPLLSTENVCLDRVL